MKTIRLIVATLIAIGFLACENVLERKVDFTVEVEKEEFIQFTDSGIVVPAGSKIQFNFDGEPDFIRFFYERFLLTNSTLNFKTQAAWGTHIENTLSVYISDSFTGLSKDSIFANDSILIRSHDWVDISAEANLPVGANDIKESSIPMNQYRGKTITLAFKYKTEEKNDWQPLWKIMNLSIENTKTTDGAHVSSYLAAVMGFTPFDMLNQDKAYDSADEAGVWNIEKKDDITIKQTARNRDLNEDWLVSKPFELPMGLTESSESIGVKNITDYKSNFTYKFDNVGEYVISFEASNSNYKHHDSVIKTIKLIVVD